MRATRSRMPLHRRVLGARRRARKSQAHREERGTTPRLRSPATAKQPRGGCARSAQGTARSQCRASTPCRRGGSPWPRSGHLSSDSILYPASEAGRSQARPRRRSVGAVEHWDGPAIPPRNPPRSLLPWERKRTRARSDPHEAEYHCLRKPDKLVRVHHRIPPAAADVMLSGCVECTQSRMLMSGRINARDRLSALPPRGRPRGD
jgi:hypothetical protein